MKCLSFFYLHETAATLADVKFCCIYYYSALHTITSLTPSYEKWSHISIVCISRGFWLHHIQPNISKVKYCKIHTFLIITGFCKCLLSALLWIRKMTHFSHLDFWSSSVNRQRRTLISVAVTKFQYWATNLSWEKTKHLTHFPLWCIYIRYFFYNI